MRRTIRTGHVLATILMLAGCASRPENIPTQYVSAIQYQDYECEQISAEMSRISSRVSALNGSLENKAAGDTAQMAIGMVLFWPALFFLEGGDGPEAQEYGRLKGEYEALQQASVQKKCGTAPSRPAEQVVLATPTAMPATGSTAHP